MPDDLSSIEGLADKHVRALARQHVTDLRGLVQADPEAMYRAMANLRPRPAREQIARGGDLILVAGGDSAADPPSSARPRHSSGSARRKAKRRARARNSSRNSLWICADSRSD